MKLLRLILNTIILAVYLVRKTAFIVTRICGSIPGIVVLCGGTVLWIEQNHQNRVLFYIPLVFSAICRGTYPYLRVRSRPRFLQAPAKPPAPPPSASTAKGRADDPDEATVIGRLDPKLRDILRQKPDATAS